MQINNIVVNKMNNIVVNKTGSICHLPELTSIQMKKVIKECETEMAPFKEKLGSDLRKIDCFSACIGRKTGLIVDDKIILHNIWDRMFEKSSLNTDRMKSKLTKCIRSANNENRYDICRLAGAMWSCLDTFMPYINEDYKRCTRM